MTASVSRLEEIASLRLQAQRLYRAGLTRAEIMAGMRITKGQLANFLIGIPPNDTQPAAVRDERVTVAPRQAEAAAFVIQGRFCRPCARRVLASEARSCPNQCAAKRMAGG